LSRKTLALAAAAALALTVLVSGSFAMTKSPAGRQATVKVAIVTDIGGLNDKGFNHLANVGLQNAVKKLGVEGRAFITQTANDRTPNLQAAAQAGYGLVFAVGVNYEFGPVDSVAPAFPNTKFTGIDVDWSALAKKPPNVRGVQFREQDAGYLVGYIAGLMIKRHPFKGKQIVSGVGANKVTAIERFFGGYRAGAKRANPKVTIYLNYANDPTFADQAKCKETTLSQLARGSGIIFEAAGGCGLGGLDAAKEKGAWGIGVDADQSFLGSHILTSATKHVEIAVYDQIKAYKANPTGYRGSFNANYTVKNGGVGYAPLSKKVSKADKAYIIPRVEKIKKLIASGKIKPPAK
jgi:basic membrane protein A